MFRTILAPLADGLDGGMLLDAALILGRQFNSHIRAAFIRPDPDTVRSVFPALGTAADLERKLAQTSAEEGRRFESWRSHNKVPTGVAPGHDGCSASWSEHVGDIETLVTRLGRVHDLIVVQRPASSALAAQRCFDAAVFGSGRPAIVMPETRAGDGEMTDHLMIAWNGSLQATRAVASALPLLHEAKRVTIFTALSYGTDAGDLGDLAEALRWHGIRTPEVIFPGRAESSGSALVEAVVKQEATMLVMGAYTHSRLRQSFLGGVTTHILGNSAIPLLMCH